MTTVNEIQKNTPLKSQEIDNLEKEFEQKKRDSFYF